MLVQLIHCYSVFSTLCATSCSTHYMIICYPFMLQADVLRKSEMKHTKHCYFMFLGPASNLLLRGVTHRNAIASPWGSTPYESYYFFIMFCMADPSSLNPWGKSTLFYQGVDHLLLETCEADRHDSYIYETDPYVLSFGRRTCNLYALRGKLHTWFSFAFKVLTPSSRCFIGRDSDTLLEAIVGQAQFFLVT